MRRTPADGTTCAQKKLWGQCSQSWMAQAGWCALTCGRCSQPAASQGPASSGCTDVAPPGGFSCAQQKAWGKVRWPLRLLSVNLAAHASRSLDHSGPPL